jgi:hypothetical protein
VAHEVLSQKGWASLVHAKVIALNSFVSVSML